MCKDFLIVSGTGQNTGKTLLICKIIEKIKKHRPITLKLSTHFHTKTDGLVLLIEANDFSIFEETNSSGQKDSQRMLKAGAFKSFYIQTKENTSFEAYQALLQIIDNLHPLIIESDVLSRKIKNALKITMIGGNKQTDEADIYLTQSEINSFIEKIKYADGRFCLSA